MINLKEDELKKINGGGVGWGIVGIGALLTFLAGLIDGYARPFKCN